MDIQTYYVAKGILLTIILISFIRKLFRFFLGSGWKYEYFFPEIYPWERIKKYWGDSPFKTKLLYSGYFVEFGIFLLLFWESSKVLGASLYIFHLILPSFLLMNFTDCLKFNLFYRNLLLAIPGFIVFFSYTSRRIDWRDYYTGLLFTAIVILTYCVGNWLLNIYNHEIEDRVVKKY